MVWCSNTGLGFHRCPRCADTEPSLSVEYLKNGGGVGLHHMQEKWQCSGCGATIDRAVSAQALSVTIEAGRNGLTHPTQLELPLRYDHTCSTRFTA